MPLVAIERKPPLLIVTIDRPEVRNAVDRPTADALTVAFEDFERDDGLLVAVLTGAGGDFCAGADLGALTSGEPERINRLEWSSDSGEIAPGPMGPTRMELSKPVIAAVEGHAVAGGLELALWCDLRVASESAVFGVFSRRWGVPLIDGGTIRLPRTIGRGRALDMILTGRPVEAREALDWGLADRLVPAGSALGEARALGETIARFPQICLRADRRSAFESWSRDEEAVLAREFQGGLGVLESGEAASGAARFAGGHGRGGSFDDG